MQCVTLENVTKSYGSKKVLTDFSLTVDEGDFISIMGASGSGKTTLIPIIFGSFLHILKLHYLT